MNIYKNIPVTGRLRVCVEKAKALKLAGKCIIDVGCSNGLMAYLLQSDKPRKYVGIDPSEKAVTQAKSNNKKAQFFVSMADKLPVKPASFDVAFLFDVIEHVPQGGELSALSETNRVLKKGGLLLLSTPHSHPLTNLLDPAWYFGHRHYSINQISKLLNKSGFKIKKIEVRGGLWFSLSLLLLYFSKWILGNPQLRNQYIEKRDDEQFSRSGIHTIYAIAVKS